MPNAFIRMEPLGTPAELAAECAGGDGCPAGQWFRCPFGIAELKGQECRAVKAGSWQKLLEAGREGQSDPHPPLRHACTETLAMRCRSGICSRGEFACPLNGRCHEAAAERWDGVLEAGWPHMDGKRFSRPAGSGWYWMQSRRAWKQVAAFVRIVGFERPKIARILLPNGACLLVNEEDCFWAPAATEPEAAHEAP